MFDWKSQLQAKIESPEQAVRRVRNGSRVFISANAAVPHALLAALLARQDLEDIQIVHMMTFGEAAYTRPELARRFRMNTFFIGANTRQAVQEGLGDYTPMHLSQIPALFRSGRMKLDFALIQVSPPDEHGLCSFGTETNIVKAATESAACVIAEVNARMPRSLGDCFVHTRDIAALIPVSTPLHEVDHGPPDEISRQIGQHVASLVDDGATLQLGIGGIPDAVLASLGDRRDLGIYTEMFSDGLLPLIERGVVTNARKTLHRGKIVATFAFGTRKLYEFIDGNPMCEFRPTEYVNDPFVIAQNDNLCAINSALEVDLTGQVCAESLGQRFYSGFGGQLDFVRGAARARGGKPIIALPSTTSDGSISRIVPELKPGAGVVTTRADVHYVVTEYGTAYLHGKSIRERAMALAQIAHPKFRPWLIGEAKARRLVYVDQIEPPITTPAYPAHVERLTKLRDGREVFIRPARLSDEPLLRDNFYTLSEQTIFRRFFEPLRALPHEKLQEFLRMDYTNDFVIVACTGRTAEAPIVAVARYNRLSGARRDRAEIAFLIRDAWQNTGLGTQLYQTLIDRARECGFRGFTAEVLQENHGMLRVLHKGGCAVTSKLQKGVFELEIDFPA